MKVHDVIDWAAQGFEIVGMGVMVLGALLAFVPVAPAKHALKDLALKDLIQGYRERLGRAIVLGLEFLVAGDILHTISTELTLTNVAALGGIVLIRTFLSFSLAVELEGRWPWQRRQAVDSP